MRPRRTLILALVSTLWLAGCQSMGLGDSGSYSSAPRAKVVPTQLEMHGQVRTDNYYWLKEREDPNVIAYLVEENNHTDRSMAHTKSLQKELYNEFHARIKQTDISVPYQRDDYYYYSRTEEGKQYPIFCRKRGSVRAIEEIMLDVNQQAAGHTFYSAQSLDVSSNQQLLAFAEDQVGRRIYNIRFKDLSTGEFLSDRIPGATDNLAWANDNKTIFYGKQDPVTLRAFQIYRHVIGTDVTRDELVYEEKDDTFSCDVSRTKSKRYIMIGSYQTLSSEYRFLDANRPGDSFQVLSPRMRNHEYSVDHYNDHFYIKTNHQAKNFRLMKTPVTSTDIESWVEVIPHRGDVLLEGFEIFKDYLVVEEREKGLVQLRIMPWSGAEERYLSFDEPAYLAFPNSNFEFDTPLLRYTYTSMTTPGSVYDYNMETHEKTLLKQEEVLGGFSSKEYVTLRLHATARDGTQVPISVVYRKGLEKNGRNPLLLYGYGSYGASMDATFDPYRVSLLDRGFVYAIAHVRGGEELGRGWYEDGKLLQKKNTFTDFIDCGLYLVEKQYTNPDQLFCQGGSAGGLLIGAVINMRPDLFKGAIASVPFVDVVTTMLDDSIPLTTGEYDEWGNPNVREFYDYILSYSPYDNVESKDYPHLLVTTSLHDSQVQYFEPAKWVAKLRAMKTDTNRLLLQTKMQAGHGGVSGRYKRYEDIAFRYAFLIDLATHRSRSGSARGLPHRVISNEGSREWTRLHAEAGGRSHEPTGTALTRRAISEWGPAPALPCCGAPIAAGSTP